MARFTTLTSPSLSSVTFGHSFPDIPVLLSPLCLTSIIQVIQAASLHPPIRVTSETQLTPSAVTTLPTGSVTSTAQPTAALQTPTVVTAQAVRLLSTTTITFFAFLHRLPLILSTTVTVPPLVPTGVRLKPVSTQTARQVSPTRLGQTLKPSARTDGESPTSTISPIHSLLLFAGLLFLLLLFSQVTTPALRFPSLTLPLLQETRVTHFTTDFSYLFTDF